MKQEINNLIAGIKFKFGNENHIQIAIIFAEINALEKSIKKNNDRKVEIREIDKKNKVLLKKIKEKEIHLERMLKMINGLNNK